MLKKKGISFAVIATVVSSAMLLAGCGNTSGNGNQSSNSISSGSKNHVTNITFWNGHPSGALQQQMHTEIAQFNQSHPDIHVSYVDKDASIQQITAAFAGNQAPNVVMPGLDNAKAFADAGYLVDLTPYMKSSNHLSQNFYPVVWNSFATKTGKRYVLPYEESTRLVIYYNQNLFNKAGITQSPKTWSEIQKDAEKITALGSDYHGIAWTPTLEQFFVMTKDFGGNVYTNSSQTKFDFNNSGAQQALSYLRAMVKDKSLLLTKGYSYQVSFGAGKAGILLDASTGYTYDKQSAGGKFKMAEVSAPAGSSGQVYNYVFGDGLSILKTGSQQQKQAAWTFIQWLSSPQVNVEWNEATNYVPTGPATKAKMADFYKSNPQFAASFSDPSNWLTIPAKNGTPYEAAMNQMMTDFQKALLGQESVPTALVNMTKVGNEYLSGQRQS